MVKMISGDHAQWKFTCSDGTSRLFTRRGLFVDAILECAELVLSAGGDTIVMDFPRGIYRRLQILNGPQPHSFCLCGNGGLVVHVLYEKIRESSLESGDNVIGTYEPVF